MAPSCGVDAAASGSRRSPRGCAWIQLPLALGGRPVARRRARRPGACGTLRTHDRRRLHRGDVTVGGFVGAGASPDIQHGPCIAERSPDPRGDPRLGAPRHGVAPMVSCNCNDFLL